MTAPELNGQILNDPNVDKNKIFWIDQGQKRWIVDEATYQGVFGGAGSSPKGQGNLINVDDGPNVESGAILVKGFNDDKDYFISQGVARWISSYAAKKKYHFSGNVHQVPFTLIENYPPGIQFVAGEV